MKRLNESRSIGTTIWLSRIIRWGLGSVFIGIGIKYFDQDGWPAILFGIAMIATGFLRPDRCIGETCDMPSVKR